jgi:Na+(H+)/acetate symporter ActP
VPPPQAVTTIGEPNGVAMAFFSLFIAVTLGITFWAARRTRTTEHFYAAGRTITPAQNGLALAGDYMSAASFLGIAGLVATTGFDGLIYSTGWLVGWPVVLFLVAEPLRNLGAFATILAVVAGLTLSGAAALSHDLWVNVVRRGRPDAAEQLKVARVATVGLGLLAVLLGVTFKGQNVAFMVGLAFAIAASANFPALVLAMFWSGYTIAGAVASMAVGTVATLVLIWLSPTVQIDVLKHATAWFPLKNPALATIPLSFAVGIAVSRIAARTHEADAYGRMERQKHLGGAA